MRTYTRIEMVAETTAKSVGIVSTQAEMGPPESYKFSHTTTDSTPFSQLLKLTQLWGTERDSIFATIHAAFNSRSPLFVFLCFLFAVDKGGLDINGALKMCAFDLSILQHEHLAGQS